MLYENSFSLMTSYEYLISMSQNNVSQKRVLSGGGLPKKMVEKSSGKSADGIPKIKDDNLR